ncbi:MAG: hypothetical protein AAGU74_14080 [Bacillota bacterium]
MNNSANPSPANPLISIDYALTPIERIADQARFILDIFDDEYSFAEDEEPDWNAAYAAAHRIGGLQTQLEKNSIKWVYEYKHALQLVSIANYLLYQMSKDIEALRKEVSDAFDHARASKDASVHERSA